MAAYAQHRQSAGRMLARLTTHTLLDKSAAGKAGLPRCRAAAISSTLSPPGVADDARRTRLLAGFSKHLDGAWAHAPPVNG